jgi:hypothetical protein
MFAPRTAEQDDAAEAALPRGIVWSQAPSLLAKRTLNVSVVTQQDSGQRIDNWYAFQSTTTTNAECFWLYRIAIDDCLCCGSYSLVYDELSERDIAVEKFTYTGSVDKLVLSLEAALCEMRGKPGRRSSPCARRSSMSWVPTIGELRESMCLVVTGTTPGNFEQPPVKRIFRRGGTVIGRRDGRSGDDEDPKRETAVELDADLHSPSAPSAERKEDK